MHIPAGGLTRGKEPLQSIGSPIFVGPNPCHGVVLGRTDRDKLGDRVYAQKIVTNFFHFPEFGLNVFCSQVADIKPKMFAIGARHTVALADVMGHPAGYHVTGCKLRLFRFVLVHKSLFIDIQECAAVTATTFRDKDVGRHNAGGVKLDGLRISDGHNPGIQYKDGTASVINDGIGGLSVDPAIASGCNEGRLCQVGPQLSGLHASGHGSGAGLPVMDKGYDFHTIMDGYA